MKKVIVFGLICFIANIATAKKDAEAWKVERNLESQFSIFKENSSHWDGYLMTKEPQINELHSAILDSVKILESTIKVAHTEVSKLNAEIVKLKSQLAETQTNLESSLLKENGLISLGISFNKSSFPTLMYSIIILLLVLTGAAILLFLRSNAVTKETESRYQELANELEIQRNRAMDRESKLRRELQTELNKISS